MAKRPLMITIVCLLFAIIGLVGLIGGIWEIVDTGVADPDMVASVIVSAIMLIIIYGLWNGIKIFWYLGVIFAVIDLIIQVYTMISTGNYVLYNFSQQQLSTSIALAVVDLIILWYLFRSNVKSYFKI